MTDAFIERTYTTPDTEDRHRAEFPDHWERYEFAANFVAGKRVLDIACGCGYGTAFLADRAAVRSVGLDVDAEAVAWARKHYGHKADYRVVENDRWPVADGTTDMVVSMETIEHVARPEDFLAEAARVLTPEGKLLVSTPCNDTEDRFKPENPFHLREYSWDEFAELLTPLFAVEKRWSQVSKLGEQWNRVKQSKLGPVLRMKRLIPKSVIAAARNFLASRPAVKGGHIVAERQPTAVVQLILASKKR